MSFFGWMGAVLEAIALFFMAPVIVEYWETGLVPRFPTLIASGFVAMAGIQAIFTGMMLKVTDTRDRKNFEYHMNRVHDRLTSEIRKDEMEELQVEFCVQSPVIYKY